ncbi:MAG: DNA/RNA nuclease SfsA [Desulfobacterales bacterium]|jgi:sugar fermentation stimulation protein A
MKPAKRKQHVTLPFPPLIRGTLLRRYKRFLADVRLENGRIVTAHCPNTGSMAGCAQPGRPVYLSVSDNPKRKLPYTWELIDMPGSLVGVNTNTPNQLVFETLRGGMIDEFSEFPVVRREVPIAKGVRIDIALGDESTHRCFLEIKNCTLVEDGIARFPDAVTQRGRRHLIELERLVAQGYRCAMFYLIQRMDASAFAPAAAIDPGYSRQLASATSAGVEVFAYDVVIDLTGIRLNRPLSVDLQFN